MLPSWCYCIRTVHSGTSRLLVKRCYRRRCKFGYASPFSIGHFWKMWALHILTKAYLLPKHERKYFDQCTRAPVGFPDRYQQTPWLCSSSDFGVVRDDGSSALGTQVSMKVEKVSTEISLISAVLSVLGRMRARRYKDFFPLVGNHSRETRLFRPPKSEQLDCCDHYEISKTHSILSFATKMVPSQTRCAPASDFCTCGVTRESADQYQPTLIQTLACIRKP